MGAVSRTYGKSGLTWSSAPDRRGERTRTIVLITRRSQVQILPPPPIETTRSGPVSQREPALSVGGIGSVVNDLSTLVSTSVAAHDRCQHAAPCGLPVPRRPRSIRRLRNPKVARRGVTPKVRWSALPDPFLRPQTRRGAGVGVATFNRPEVPSSDTDLRITSLVTARMLPSDRAPWGLPARYRTHWSGTRGSGLYSQYVPVLIAWRRCRPSGGCRSAMRVMA